MWKVTLKTKALSRAYKYKRAEIARQQYDFWVVTYGLEAVEIEYLPPCRCGEP
jgi:hypothetical protein